MDPYINPLCFSDNVPVRTGSFLTFEILFISSVLGGGAYIIEISNCLQCFLYGEYHAYQACRYLRLCFYLSLIKWPWVCYLLPQRSDSALPAHVAHGFCSLLLDLYC